MAEPRFVLRRATTLTNPHRPPRVLVSYFITSEPLSWGPLHRARLFSSYTEARRSAAAYQSLRRGITITTYAEARDEVNEVPAATCSVQHRVLW